jgi:hypothetical protein
MSSAINFVLGCKQLHELPPVVGAVFDRPMSQEAVRVRYGQPGSRADQLQQQCGPEPDVAILQLRLTTSTTKAGQANALAELQQMGTNPRRAVASHMIN